MTPRLPHGAWPSPVSAASVAAGGLRLGDIRLDGDDTYWCEGRPSEGGRCVVVRHRRDGGAEDAIPPPFSARTTVHEYGGAAYAVDGGTIFFSNGPDQRLYRGDGGAEPRPLTPAGPLRFADLVVDPGRERVICVVEDHSRRPPGNRLAAVPAAGGEPVTLASGRDFYSSPRLSPDGGRLAWLAWDQPAMPWDGCELWVSEVVAGGSLAGARLVAGGPDESIVQPEWSPDGVLHLVSDRSGWWNLHRVGGGAGPEAVEAVAPMEAECGRPHWVFGLSTYAFTGPGRLAVCACRRGVWHLLLVDEASGTVTERETPFTDMGRYVRARGERLVLDAGGPRAAPAIVSLDAGGGGHEVLRSSTSVELSPDDISAFEEVCLPASDGGTVYGFLHRPRSSRALPSEGEAPPLLVRVHGGPTSAAGTALDPGVQYWTTRGIAVVDVNYRGSSGYGRAHRRRLSGQWGVGDVLDCVDAALGLAERGDADRERLVISGGSAGGYVVLCALSGHDAFAAGASHYGVADVEALLRDTHKFEARYFDDLIGPYPQERERYRERSPVHAAGAIRRPLILFQGLDDPIVPANQAEAMFEAVRSRGIPCAYLAFEGEQHGFRQEATIRRVLEAELYFYSRILGFHPADDLPPVVIDNLPPGPVAAQA